MASNDEPWRLTASELLAAYRSGELAPDDVIAGLLARIGAIDPALNAYVALSPTAEAEAARSAERWRRGAPIGPLDGVPVAVKDNLVVAGMPATFGSRLYAARIPEADELPIERLRKAGAIVIGKTNTPEFAVEGVTRNALFGSTGNPFAPELTPGGSSGGSVAAVAAGLAPVAIGTDGGGSTRRPAAYTGLIGLKPGIGHIARAGGLAQILLDFEVVGTFARSASDMRLLDDVLAGPDRRDPASLVRPAPPPRKPSLSIRLVERIGGAPCAPEILAALHAFADELTAMGHEVTAGPLGIDTAALAAVWPTIVETGLARIAETEPDFAACANPRYVEVAERGKSRRAAELLAALEAVSAARRDAARLFEDCDVVLMPACAAMPWPRDEYFPTEIAGQTVGPRGHAVYTGWVNAAGLPGLTLPCQVPAGALPIGVQLIADRGGEGLLLDLAAASEARRGSLFPHWPAIAQTAAAGAP